MDDHLPEKCRTHACDHARKTKHLQEMVQPVGFRRAVNSLCILRRWPRIPTMAPCGIARGSPPGM